MGHKKSATSAVTFEDSATFALQDSNMTNEE